MRWTAKVRGYISGILAGDDPIGGTYGKKGTLVTEGIYKQKKKFSRGEKRIKAKQRLLMKEP